MIESTKIFIAIVTGIMILSCSNIVFALNIDYRIDTVPVKLFVLPNETFKLNVTLINRDIFSAKNTELTIIIGTRQYAYEVGDLKPSGLYNTLIDMPQFPPGTYTIKGIANYTETFDQRFITETYNSFDVKFPQIEKFPRGIYVKEFSLPNNITEGKTYTALITVSNEGEVPGDLIIEVASLNDTVNIPKHLDPGQSDTIELNITFSNPGTGIAEGRIFAVINKQKYFLGFLSKQIFVREAKTAKILFDRIEFVNEPDNAVNQQDNVILNVFLRNTGNDIASNVNATLITDNDNIIIQNPTAGYILILPSESLPKEISLKTNDASVGDHKIVMHVDYSDSLGFHQLNTDIPIKIVEGGDVCKLSNDCNLDEICEAGMCKKIVCERGEIINHQCKQYECIENKDCGGYNICDLSTHICLKCKDEHCCAENQMWCSGQQKCSLPIQCIGVPLDTLCTSGWPAKQGPSVLINERNYACDLFEVTDNSLLPIVQEAATCCSNMCNSSSCNSFCKNAYDQSGLKSGLDEAKFKKCTGFYIMYGLGPAAEWMKGYYDNEIKCSDSLYNGRAVNCATPFSKTSKYLQCMRAEGQPKGWISDTDLTKNSCIFSDLPAHANLNLLSTGTCVDYSVSFTTLLRMLGYSKNEIYSVTGPGHEFNLIKFPGELKWNFVDTVGNNPSPYNSNGIPGSWYNYCDYYQTSCANDGGQGTCPTKSEIKGC
jgi:hypothetical protein